MLAIKIVGLSLCDNMKIKRRIYEIIEASQDGDLASLIFDWFIIILICLNVFAVIISSLNNVSVVLSSYLYKFEIFSIIIFTFEYALRIWTSQYKYPNSKVPCFRYIFSFMAIIDLLAIIPFYLPFIVNIDLRYLRILRLFRMLRILKLNRYNNSFDLIGRVLKNEREKLLITLFIMVILLLFASSSMYFIENAVQPDKFTDILSTLWWAVATLTTIGYGDIFPITPLGKILGGVIAILGIGLIALSSGIISSGIIQEVSKNKKELICPHCGKKFIE
jgi:voltage-gated potassium channel